jgi:ATP-binding cassette subfamily B protein
LDPQAESDLFEALHDMARDHLVIFVSHRLATVRSADAILVLDQGEVVEFGTHQELMATAGLYYDLFTLQAARYGGAD